MKKIFIDGKAGTTGLRIEERLAGRDDVCIISLPDELRKDTAARKKAMNEADVVFLCLPDDAAREAVGLIESEHTVVIDASTAHRTDPAWAYGFPELDESFENAVKSSKRIANPGCHASGFIALIYPLVKAGILSPDTPLTVHSITGYSGGGKKMIADYQGEPRDPLLDAPRQYGLSQNHKHLPEMTAVCGLSVTPIFCPIVSDFYSGMEVTVPIFKSQLKKGDAAAIRDIYKKLYTGPVVSYVEGSDESGFLSAVALGGKDSMQVEVHGNDDRILLVARYDNLGKGASGSAVECLNIVLGCEKTKGLEI